MTNLQNNLMEAFLKTLTPGRKALAVNGRLLTFEGMSSDGHSYVFVIDGIAGRKVYNAQGVGSALPSNFSIDVSRSLELGSEIINVEDMPKEMVRSFSGSPMWVFYLLQTGALKEYGQLEIQGYEKSRAIYKGISQRGNPIFSVLADRSYTCEFDFDGVSIPVNGGRNAKSLRLKVPENYFRLELEHLFSNVKKGDTLYMLDGGTATVSNVTTTRSMSTSSGGYLRQYNCNGISTSKNLKHALVSTKPPIFEIPLTARRYPIQEIAPGRFAKLGYMATSKKDSLKVVPAKKTPMLKTLADFLTGTKEHFLILTQDGKILKIVSNEADAQFETTVAANALPGTKVQLVKVQVLGYSEVPVQQAVFKAI